MSHRFSQNRTPAPALCLTLLIFLISPFIQASTVSPKDRFFHFASKVSTTSEDTVEEVIDGHPELLGNPEFNYREFLWRLNIFPQRHQLPYSLLTDDEAVSIIAYTSKLSEVLNGRLRSGADLGEFKVIVDRINSGLRKLPPYTGWVYRSTHPLPPEIEKMHAQGQVVRYSAFTSTSQTGFHDALFGNEHFKIYSLSGRDISPISIYFERDSEREILFPSEAQFEVLEPEELNGVQTKRMKEVLP